MFVRLSHTRMHAPDSSSTLPANTRMQPTAFAGALKIAGFLTNAPSYGAVRKYAG